MVGQSGHSEYNCPGESHSRAHLFHFLVPQNQIFLIPDVEGKFVFVSQNMSERFYIIFQLGLVSGRSFNIKCRKQVDGPR